MQTGLFAQALFLAFPAQSLIWKHIGKMVSRGQSLREKVNF